MPKIPESYGIIANQSPKEELKPKEKINKIEAIVEYLSVKNGGDIEIYFKHFNIELLKSIKPIPSLDVCKQDFSKSSLQYSLQNHNFDANIIELYNYIFEKNINDFFHDKEACFEIFKNEKYIDLKILLDECFNCINQNNLLASVIILRASLESWMIYMGFNDGNLEDKIKTFIKTVEDGDNYQILKEKVSEIKDLLNLYRKNGNGVAHCNISEAQKYIENYSLKKSLKLLCILIEETIFAKDIKEINKEKKKKRINSIDFETKKSF